MLQSNYNSWHARIYKYFYNIDNNELPDNLCAYFYKSLFSILLFIPYALFEIPSRVFPDVGRNTNVNKIFRGLVFYFGIFLIISFFIKIIEIFYYDFNLHPKLDKCIILGFSMVCIIIMFGIFVLIGYLFKTIKNKFFHKHNESQKTNLLLEFIKAKKNKYCPKIEWKNN